MKSFYSFYNKIISEASVHPVILKDSESIIKKAIYNYFLIKSKKLNKKKVFEDFVISSKNNKNEIKDVDVSLSLNIAKFDDTNEYDIDLKNWKFPNFINPIKVEDYYSNDIDEDEEIDYEKALEKANNAPEIIKKHLFKKLEDFKPSNHTITFEIDFHPKATYEKVADTLTKEIMSEIQKRINNLQ